MPESHNELGHIQSLRRSVTLPKKLNPLTQRRSSLPNTPEHVIFYHPSAKVVHFAPRALAPIPSSSAPSDFDYPVDTIETLPWRSATERTVATAPLRLEKIHGSTAFLKCGNVVHAILKNSQCWCVDGVSKFVLRIRPLTYYRIEIPYKTGEDQGLVQELKTALPTVLRYEVTPCPFKRTFSVELPSDAMAPRRKKAWQPKDRCATVPRALDSPLETPSPSSTRSAWNDSASAGDNKDVEGTLTDGNCFTLQKVNSANLDTLPNQLPSPSKKLGLSSSHVPRRSVTETPQTFSGLLAKFQVTPTLEENENSESKPNGDTSLDVEITASSKADTEAVETHTPEPSAESQIPSRPELEPPADIEFTPESELHAEHWLGAESQAQLSNEIVVQAGSKLPTQDGTALDANTSDLTGPQITVEFETASPQGFKDNRIQHTAEHTLDVDHDTSFTSGPESCHSPEPQSPDSVSTHPTSVGGHDFLEPTDIFSLSSVKEHTFSMKETAVDLYDDSQLPALDTIQTPEVPSPRALPNAVMSRLSPKDTPGQFPDTCPGSFTQKERTSDTADVSRDEVTSRPVTDTVRPNTDLNYMSTEFRRRAQATRECDASPNLQSSALYKPSPGEEAKSFISKAITLVLIPPAYLFVILLHIAARVVINPPTVHPTAKSPAIGSRHSLNQPRARSVAGVPERSSESKDAETRRKLDHWDLD